MDRRHEKSTGHYDTREELEAAIRTRYAQSLTYSEIAEQVGVSEGTVYRVAKEVPDGGHKTLEIRHREKDMYLRFKLNELWVPRDVCTCELDPTITCIAHPHREVAK